MMKIIIESKPEKKKKNAIQNTKTKQEIKTDLLELWAKGFSSIQYLESHQPKSGLI